MADLNGAEALVRMLQLHGVRHIFGLCGDTSLPYYDALKRLDHGMNHVLTRDERSAGYMADAYARVTGRVGVCEGPSGGGATYLAPGIIEANESSIPVLAITSDVGVSSRGHFPLTELDQAAFYAPLTKWNMRIDLPGQIPHAVRTAFRAMTTGRPGAAHLCLPYDVQKQAVSQDEIWGQEELGIYPSWRSGPSPSDIERAVTLLLNARQPVIICGGGVINSGAESELDALARFLGAPVCTTISGKGTMADDHALSVGVVGANGGILATRAVVEAADLVLFIGCRAGSTTTEHYRFPRRDVPIVHIDVDAQTIGTNYRTDAALVGDAKVAIAALLAALEAEATPRDNAAAAALASRARDAKRAQLERLAFSNSRPIVPERVLYELNRVLPEESIVVADPGTPCPYASAYLEMRRPGRSYITNRAHGALGFSMSASIGAWYGRPSAKTVALMGDGSFGFTAGEMETMTRLNVPVTMVVFSNKVYGWIKASQKAGYDERYFSVDFNRTDHARVAEAFGVKSFTVEDPAEVGNVLRQAIAHDGPTLVDVISQPLEEAAAPVSQWMG
jgi:acetolactate synthase-1/2/3 large subunit